MAWRSKSSKSRSAIGLIAVIAIHLALIAALTTGVIIDSVQNRQEPIQIVDLPEEPPQKPIEPEDPIVPKDPEVSLPPEPQEPGPIQIEPDPSEEGAGGTTTNPAPGINSGEPEYPPTERRLGHTGQVVLTICIAADGRLTSATVKRSSTYPLLDQSALQWARSIRWRPGTVNGRAVDMCYDQPYRFVIKDQ